MKNLKKIRNCLFYIIITILLSGNKVSENSYPCKGISIVTELKNWRIYKGKKIYVNSGKWDEYDENGSKNPIPDSLDVILNIDILSYYLKHYFVKGDERIEDFELTVEIKFKAGLTSNCINVVNPRISEGYNVINNIRINYDNFFYKDVYKSYRIKRSIKIKDLLKQAMIDKKLMLSQIIIISKIKSIYSQDDCLVEYTLPICL